LKTGRKGRRRRNKIMDENRYLEEQRCSCFMKRDGTADKYVKEIISISASPLLAILAAVHP